MNKKKWKQWVYWFTFAVAVIFVYKTLDSFDSIINWLGDVIDLIMPFILAILIAYIFYIPSKKVELFYRKSKVNFIKNRARGLSVLTIYIIAILIITIIINFVLPSISKSIVELFNSLPGYYENAIQYIDNLPPDSILNKIDIKSIISNLQNIDISQFFKIESITGYAKGVIDFAGIIFDLFVTIIVSIYLLLERTEILNFAKKLTSSIFKSNVTKKINNYFRKTNEIFYKFIYSQVLDAFIIGILISIALSIMNVKYAVLLGLMIGIFNIIPYFGAIVASVIAIIITIFTGGFGQAIIMAIVVIILQQIDANIINPKIVGSSLKLSPILIIFAVTVGGAYFGILGMFLSVPIVAIIKILVLDYIELKSIKRIREDKHNKGLKV